MSTFPGFPRGASRFMAQLVANNERPWYEANKTSYETDLLNPAKAFVVAVAPLLQKELPALRAEPKVNGSIMRLNRDTRFSKDKRPYKDYFGLWFWEGRGKSRECPGYFWALTGKSLVLGNGMHGFMPEQLARYRKAATAPRSSKALRRAVDEVAAAGATLGGTHYKRVPAGFAEDHTNADLLKHNGLFAYFEDKLPAEFFDKRAAAYCAKKMLTLAPLHRWLVENVG